jgi:predicted transposase YdaD
VDADQPLKVLFRTRPRDLLPLTGDAGSRVLSASVLELSAARRTVDLTLALKRRGERYVRHLEFQSRHRADLALRCFEYALRLVVQLRLPVLTTVIYTKPPAPRNLAFQEVLFGEVVHERRFEVVRLWEHDVGDLLALGPGGAALAGLLDRGDIRVIARASRQIQRQAPRHERPDLLATLRTLCAGRYTAEQLARVIPKEVVMASSLYKEIREMAREKGLAEGRQQGLQQGLQQGIRIGAGKGLAQGRLAEARTLCATFVKRHHALVASCVLPAIEACTSVARLHQWTLRAPEVSSDEFVQLVRKSTSARATHRRAPRPARRSRRTVAR